MTQLVEVKNFFFKLEIKLWVKVMCWPLLFRKHCICGSMNKWINVQNVLNIVPAVYLSWVHSLMSHDRKTWYLPAKKKQIAQRERFMSAYSLFCCSWFKIPYNLIIFWWGTRWVKQIISNLGVYCKPCLAKGQPLLYWRKLTSAFNTAKKKTQRTLSGVTYKSRLGDG